MRIGKKLTFITIAIVLVGIGVLITAILLSARREISALVAGELTNLAREEASQTQVWLETYMETARTMAGIMVGSYRDIDWMDRRRVYDTFIRSVAEGNPDIIGAGTVWEPDAVDGRDADFAGTSGSDSTGRFLSYWAYSPGGARLQACTDYETPGLGDYNLIPKRTGKETLIDPYTFEVGGVTYLMTSAASPVKIEGAHRGVAFVDIGVSAIHQRVQNIKPVEGSVAAVYSNNGTVVGHFDGTRVGKNMRDTEAPMSGQYLDGLMQAVKEGKPYAFTNYSPYLKQVMYFTAVPIFVGGTGTPWSLLIGIPVATANAPLRRMMALAVPIVIGMCMLIIGAVFVVSGSISRPLGSMKQSFDFIGDGNFTRELAIETKDEIGDICRSFNQTQEKIRHLIITIKERAESLSEVSGKLSGNMSETAIAVDQITAAIRGVRGLALNQSAGVAETNAAMGRITGNIDRLNSLVNSQTESVSQSSAAVEEMLENIQSVTRTLVKNAANVAELISAAEVGRGGLYEVSADIQEVARQSEGLLEINGVMESIAGQTNLLAMNAAIEAAHAGDVGKGFAVVADEIRKLAESSGEQSKTISGVLQKIKESIDKITASTNGVMAKFEAIDGGIKTVADQEEHIRGAMEEQTAGSKQVLEAIGRLNDLTRQVQTSAEDMLEGSKQVITESRNLERVTEDITGGMNDMSGGAERIDSAVTQVNELANLNRENIDILSKEVSRFTV
ncbi:MAG: methyl-accepting chemotaxis protein [Spirochaetaceae bacterium]|jgi:methyl-accepting chemotaxis protein|nr:methyl-accepting chemotaxis protein [Spirochaetaceae bacterium]